MSEALALDPTDEVVRARLVDFVLGDAEHAMHHLGQTVFLGNPDDAREAIALGRDLLSGMVDAKRKKFLASEAKELEHLLDAWERFIKEGGDDFPAWCRERGLSFTFRKVYYYRRA